MKPQKATPKPAATKPTAPAAPKPVILVVTLTRSTKARKSSSVFYEIPGLRATVRVARTAFNGSAPDTLVVQGQPFVAPKANLTKEERAALRAALTPADKARLARERANRAIARAARLEAAL